MLEIEDGMKVRINEYYCDISEDGWGRKSNIRYVVMDELPRCSDLCLLAKTKKEAIDGRGYIYSKSVVEKIIGWWC